MIDEVQTGSGQSVAAKESPDLESVMHLIWDRLDGIEAERRRTRRTAAIFATSVLAIAVLWTGFPDRRPDGAPVLLRDEAGNVRARVDVDAESGRTTFELVDKSGAPQAVLGTDVAGPMLTFYDTSGAARMRIGLEDESEAPIVDVVDKVSGEQSRVSLVSLREARSLPLPPVNAPEIRQVSVTADRPARQRRVIRYSTCAPGVLGCQRISRVERSPGRG